MIERASPAELRKALEVARQLAQAGILFVPLPVIDEMDKPLFEKMMHNQMARFDELIEAEGNSHGSR